MVILVLPFVYATTFTDVQLYDDEGTLMITFRDMIEGRRLYNDEYALYGPFYYLTVGGLFTTLHLPLTHDVVRIISAVFWLACTITLASLVYRLTRSLSTSGLAFLTALFFLRFYSHSPTHPQEMSFLLVACLPHFLLNIERGATRVAPIAIGVMVAGLILTKINIGVFVAIAIALAASRVSERRIWSDLIFALAAIAALVLPVVLMIPLIQFKWVMVYCVFATATIASALLVWWRTDAPVLLTTRHWAIALSAAVATAVIIIGVLLLRGTTLAAMFNAVVVQNTRFAQNWYIVLSLGPLAGVSTLGATGAALGYRTLRSHAATRDLADHAALWLKLVLSVVAIVLVYIRAPDLASELLFKIFAPFCWVLLIPAADGRSGMPFVRGGIGLLSALMVLYPFPVAGDQVAGAMLLPGVMMPVLLHDAILGLRELHSTRWKVFHWQRYGAALAIIAFGAIFAIQTRKALADYASRVLLRLPGMTMVRVNEKTAVDHQWAIQELSRCGEFYTMPGQLSFYFWTGKKSPTGLNNNNSLGLLSWDQQERVIADLSVHTDMCVLTVPPLQRQFDRGQVEARPPLLRYIEENFSLVSGQGPFILLKRKQPQNSN